MLLMTIVIVSCIVNSLQLSIMIVILPLSLSSTFYQRTYINGVYVNVLASTFQSSEHTQGPMSLDK